MFTQVHSGVFAFPGGGRTDHEVGDEALIKSCAKSRLFVKIESNTSSVLPCGNPPSPSGEGFNLVYFTPINSRLSYRQLHIKNPVSKAADRIFTFILLSEIAPFEINDIWADNRRVLQ